MSTTDSCIRVRVSTHVEDFGPREAITHDLKDEQTNSIFNAMSKKPLARKLTSLDEYRIKSDDAYKSSGLVRNRKRKRKPSTIPASVKRTRIDQLPSARYDGPTSRGTISQAKQATHKIVGLVPEDESAYALSETAHVKVKYIIAERDLRRERAQYGKASREAIAALSDAGRCMQMLMDDQAVAVHKCWEQDLDALIAEGKALVNAKQALVRRTEGQI